MIVYNRQKQVVYQKPYTKADSFGNWNERLFCSPIVFKFKELHGNSTGWDEVSHVLNHLMKF